MPVTAALITAGVTTGVEGISAAYKNYKAKQIAKSNIRPQYVPNEQILENADLAASRAGTGLSDASRTLYTQENQRNLSQSLDAILRGGGGVNQIADLYANNNDSLLKLTSMDSQLQNANVNTFLNANEAKGKEYQSAWEINQFAPYNDRAQLAATLRNQSQQELSKALQTAEQGTSNYFIGTMYKDSLKNNNNTGNANADGIEGAFKTANDNYTPAPVKANQYYDNPSQRYINLLLQGDQNSLNDYNTGWG